MPNSWFLCPGLGTQGGKMKDTGLFQDAGGRGAWFPMSSSLTKCEENDLLEISFQEVVRKNIIKSI